MPTTLWHFTWPAAVEPILREGFRDGDLGGLLAAELGGVYFAAPPSTYHEMGGQVLVEVVLNVDAADLEDYASHIVGVYHWDEALKKRIWADDGSYHRIDYKMPAAFVNQHAVSVRVVPPAEFRR